MIRIVTAACATILLALTLGSMGGCEGGGTETADAPRGGEQRPVGTPKRAPGPATEGEGRASPSPDPNPNRESGG